MESSANPGPATESGAPESTAVPEPNERVMAITPLVATETEEAAIEESSNRTEVQAVPDEVVRQPLGEQEPARQEPAPDQKIPEPLTASVLLGAGGLGLAGLGTLWALARRSRSTED